jgi:sugar phosphate isomerase/epimerase
MSKVQAVCYQSRSRTHTPVARRWHTSAPVTDLLEFARFDGRFALDVLLDAAGAQAVRSELDVYWVTHASVDPGSFRRRLGSRCAIVHLKDMVKDGSRAFAEVGEWRLDFPAIFAAAQAAGVEYYVVEQDSCQRLALESTAIRLKNLRSWGIA